MRTIKKTFTSPYNHHMSRPCHHIVTLAIAYLALVATLLMLITLVDTIPYSAIEGNLRASVDELAAEGEKPVHRTRLLTQDNVTDCIMMNIAAGVDYHHPLKSAMANKFHFNEGGSLFDATRDLLNGNPVDVQEYARYWHGYQTLLRPLLCITDYRGIRLINYLSLAILGLLCIILSYKKVSHAFSIALVIGLACVGITYVPLNIQYTTCFFIMFTAMLTILLLKPKYLTTSRACVGFFVLGGLTSYCDLLTTPIITLGPPLIVFCLMHKPKRAFRAVMLLSLMWLGGYASIWISKWVLASVITGSDIIGDAMANARIRTVGSSTSEEGATTVSILLTVWQRLSTKPVFLSVIIALAALVAAYWRGRQPSRVIRDNAWLLLVAIMPLIWSAILMQHTYIHFFFTWRIGLVTIVALIVFFAKTINWQTIIKKS